MLIKTNGNKIYLHGQIWSNEELYFSHYFDAMDGKHDEIEVHIHTRGGDVICGNYIDNKLLNATSKIHTINDGLAASMGGMMLISGDTVSMVDNGYIMLHAPSGTTRGNAAKHNNVANLLGEMEKDFVKRIIKRTGLTEAKAKKMIEGDNWFSAAQAKKANLIDNIIPAKIKLSKEPGATLEIGAVYNAFSALLDGDPTATHQPTNDTDTNDKFNPNTETMKQALITAFALTSVTAESSDTAIIEAIQAKHKAATGAIEAKLTEKTTALTALQTSIETEKEAQVTAALAPFKGKVDAAAFTAYETIGKTAGLEALQEVLKTLKSPTAPFQAITPGGTTDTGSPVGRESWDWDKWQTEDPRGIEALAKTNPEAYEALLNAKFPKQQ